MYICYEHSMSISRISVSGYGTRFQFYFSYNMFFSSFFFSFFLGGVELGLILFFLLVCFLGDLFVFVFIFVLVLFHFFILGFVFVFVFLGFFSMCDCYNCLNSVLEAGKLWGVGKIFINFDVLSGIFNVNIIFIRMQPLIKTILTWCHFIVRGIYPTSD